MPASCWWKNAAAAIRKTIRNATARVPALIIAAGITLAAPAQATSPLLLAAKKNYQGTAPRWHYRVVERIAQDRALFTQGLQFHDGRLYLSSGLYGASRIVSFDAGNNVLQRINLPADVFAEGLAVGNGTLHVLTWHERRLLRFDQPSLTPLPTLTYRGEGWGLAFDGRQLIRSDGSDTLFFHAVDDFRELRSIRVRDGRLKVSHLNELEWVQGVLLANIWVSNTVVAIDPASGRVAAHLDLRGLLPARDIRDDTDVLNGIAWDAQKQQLWITGKRWPARFALEVKELMQTRPTP